MYISKDIGRLQKYCDDNIKKIVKTSERKYFTAKMDVGKTVDRKMVETLKVRDVPCTVDYTVRGSITYDPNTYLIKYASTPIVLDKVITAPVQYVIVTQMSMALLKLLVIGCQRLLLTDSMFKEGQIMTTLISEELLVRLS